MNRSRRRDRVVAAACLNQHPLWVMGVIGYIANLGLAIDGRVRTEARSATLNGIYGAAARFQLVRSVMPFGVRGLSNLSSSEVSRVIVLF